MDCWPLIGREQSPGEFSCFEHDKGVVHSVYDDDEPNRYFSGLNIVWKEKRTTWFREQMAKMSKEEWINWYKDDWTNYKGDDWLKLYDERVQRYSYSHLFYIVRKPT